MSLVMRLSLVALVAAVAVQLRPVDQGWAVNAAVGAAVACVILLIERAVRDAPGTRMLGGTAGALVGLVAGGARSQVSFRSIGSTTGVCRCCTDPC